MENFINFCAFLEAFFGIFLVAYVVIRDNIQNFRGAE